MCSVLKVSPAGFYSWLGREESNLSKDNRRLTSKIEQIHKETRQVYGAPRVHRELLEQNERCGKNRVARLMKAAGFRSKVRKKYRVTTNSSHSRPVAPNLLKDRSFPARLNEVWVSDITYIPTREGWSYLASIMDLASRSIVGWAMEGHMTTDLVASALKMAIECRRPASGLIHHSDRGSQYASKEYQDLLDAYDMQCSMSGKGNCYDNAFKESFFRSLKTEEVHHKDYQTRQEARLSVFDYIETFYNPKRLHSSLGYQAPRVFEQKFAIEAA